MNPSSEVKIRDEFKTQKEIQNLLENRPTLIQCEQMLFRLKDEVGINARWGAVTDPFARLKSCIFTVLESYQNDHESAEQALRRIKGFLAEAMNDQRDALLLCDEFFGQLGPSTIKEVEERNLEKYGSTDWQRICNKQFPKLYSWDIK